MERKCWFCKNTEELFLKEKEELLKTVEHEISECEKIEKSIVDITKEKLGFTDENKNKVKNIQEEYSNMTLNAVLENSSSFIKLEPNLNIVLEYYKKYGSRNFRTVKEVINQFLSEPIESRYSHELRNNEYKKKGLLEKKEKLENIKTFFVEKEITPESIDSGITQLKNNQSEFQRISGNYNSRYQQNLNIQEKDFSFSYKGLGFKFSKKILICPVCLSLFLESANASLDIMKAQKDAQMSADWDDDDDDFE